MVSISPRTLVRLRLTPLQYDMVDALIQSHPDPVSLGETERLLGAKTRSGMYVCVKNLREKLISRGIEVWSIHGVGYRFSDKAFAALKEETEQ